MIFIEHFKGRVTSDLYNGDDIVTALFKYAQMHPEEGLVLFKKGIETTAFVNQINNKTSKAFLISNSNLFNEDLGYIEDKPFMSVKTSITYPTWIKGTSLIYIHAALINQVQDQVDTNRGLLYWINSVSKLARPLGVLSYQVPLYPEQEKLSTIDLYRFVAAHYKKRWVFLMVLNHLYYERRFPLYAFAKAQFQKQKKLKIDVASLQETSTISEQEKLIYDVAIPTMGRPQYLLDVLKDLNCQDTPPETVIIIEQNGDKEATSGLNDVLNTVWKFKIVHRFTHIMGACRARNEATSLSTAPWILFFDDDVRLKDGFIKKAQEFISKTSAKCVTFACLQKDEIETQQTYKQWESFGSGCSLVHRDIFSRCSFDMALEHGYGEDLDYGMQVRNLGQDVIYAPQIQLLHLKAPIGGFRKPHKFPWNNQEIQPKPSPQIMYFRKKNLTIQQVRGYKMMQLFKTYGFFKTKNPFKHLQRFKQAWNESEKWAARL